MTAFNETPDVHGVLAEDSQTGERDVIVARALFAFIGAAPDARRLSDMVALDDHGFVLTGGAGRRDPGARVRPRAHVTN